MGARSINLALRLRLARRPSVIRLEFGAAGGSSFGASSVAWKMHAPDADRVCVKHGAASLFYVYRVRGGIHTLKDLSAGDADGGTEGAGAGRDGRGETLNKYGFILRRTKEIDNL